jgi:hypothetical protein
LALAAEYERADLFECLLTHGADPELAANYLRRDENLKALAFLEEHLPESRQRINQKLKKR